MHAIRDYCLGYCALSTDHRDFCRNPQCPLYLYRFGRPPRPHDYYASPGDATQDLDMLKILFVARIKSGWRNPFVKASKKARVER